MVRFFKNGACYNSAMSTNSKNKKVKFMPGNISIADAQEDINNFFTKAEQVHPNLLAAMEPEEYLKLKKRTAKEVSGKMKGGRVAIKDLAYALCYAAASFQDGHTSIRYHSDLPGKYIKAAHFPPFLLGFRNGAFYVQAAQDRGLEGAKLISVNGASFQDFAKPILDRCSAELFHAKAKSFARRQLFWWAFSGLFSGLKTFSIKAQASGGRTIVKKLTVVGPEIFECLGSQVTDIVEENTSLDFIKNRSIAYLRYPRFENSSAEKRILDRIFSEVNKSGVRSLIIDIRGNGGGDSLMGDFIMKYITARAVRSYSKVEVKISEELLNDAVNSSDFKNFKAMKGLILTWHLREKKQRKPKAFFSGKVYLLTDNMTFSSASDLAAMFRDYECGRIIGYETGGLSISFGNILTLALKHSGIKFGVSCKNFYGPRPRPGDEEHGILPDVPVTEAILSKYKTSDPVLSFAADYIKNVK
jgi:hypothetical protein